MKVKYWMTKDPVTIGPDETINEAARIMQERGFRRLPVMDGGRLVGLVTRRNILDAQPSAASTLSVHEARYLVDKLKVSDVMRRSPVTVASEDDVLKAVMEGHQKRIGAFPVVDDGRLVGIVTVSDLFNLIMHILGAGDREDFIYLEGRKDEVATPGYLSKLAGAIAWKNIAVLNFLSFPSKEDPEKTMVLIRISSGHRAEAVELLGSGGFKVLN